MRLDGRRWRTRIADVRLGASRYRVIRPERPPRHASLHSGRFWTTLSVDRASAADLTIAWWLASRSPRSIVHLPLRSSRFPCGEETGGPMLDMVLMHHGLQFPVSRWKEVRARSGPSRLHTVTIPVGALPPRAAVRTDRRDFRDHLRWKVAVGTLFVVGSGTAFEREGSGLREFAETTSAEKATWPERHCCAEIELGRWNTPVPDRRDPLRRLHVEACDRHW